MPFFKSTKDILKSPWEDELFNPNWMDSDKLVLPPSKEWDYSRELSIEDVDIWEVLYQQGGGLAFYAAWMPYAEFYLITLPAYIHVPNRLETYYGPNAQKKVLKRAKELNINLTTYTTWVEPEDMWLYQTNEPKTLIV